MSTSMTLARSVTLALAATSGMASAAQLDYTLYTGIEHSNNVNLTSSDPISENILTPGLSFNFMQQGSTLQVNAIGNLEYEDYLNNHFKNQTLGQLSGQANCTIVPQRLDLIVEDYAGVEPVDTLASNAPDNQQQTNVLVLGPTLYFRLGDTFRGQAELRYINSYASKVTEFNSSRGQAAFRVYKDLSATDQLSANVETQHVDFTDSTGGPNYDRNEVFGRYVSKLAKFDTDVVVGWSQLSFDHAGSDSAPLARLSLGWRPTSRSSLVLSGAYQYADAVEDMIVQPGQPLTTQPGQPLPTQPGGISTGNAVIDSQVYLERRLDLTYSFRTERLTFSAAPFFEKLDYVNNTTFNQTGRGLAASIDYRLRPTLTLSGFATGERLTYQTLDRLDKTYRYGLDLSEQWTPHWSWHAALTRQLRTSDATGQSYNENEIYFGVIFRR